MSSGNPEISEDDYIDDHEELEKVAESIYDVDYHGMVLNGVLAALSSSLGSLGAYILQDIGVPTAIMIFLVMFTPSFLTKVLAEYAKRRAVREGKVEAWMRGVRDSHKVQFQATDTSNNYGGWMFLFYFCNQASLVRSSIFDYHSKPSLF